MKLTSVAGTAFRNVNWLDAVGVHWHVLILPTSDSLNHLAAET